MKKTTAVAFALVLSGILIPSMSHAQRFELVPFVGYKWSGSVQSGNYGTIGQQIPFVLDVKNGMNMGVILDLVMPTPQVQLEFFWERQDTELDLEDTDTGEITNLGGLNIHFFHFGAIYEFYQPYSRYAQSSRIRPFLGVTFGGTWLRPEAEGVSDEVNFSAGFVLGIKTYIDERLGVRLQSRMTSTFLSGDDVVFCDQFGNCFVVAGASLINQIDLSAGLLVAF